MPELPAAAGLCATGAADCSAAGMEAGAAGVATGTGCCTVVEPGALSAAWHIPAASSEGSKASLCPRETSLLYTGDLSEIVIFIIIYSELLTLE